MENEENFDLYFDSRVVIDYGGWGVVVVGKDRSKRPVRRH